MMRLYC